MEVIQKVIEYKRSDVFKIYPFNDIHAGSIDCVEEDVKARVKECLGEKNSYAIGLGDYCDSITKNDPRFNIDGLAPWVEKSNIAESQRKWVSELFKGLAGKGKLLCLGTGNHEEEIHMRHDNDIVRNICNDLKVPYAGYAYFLVLHFRRTGENYPHGASRTYVIHCWHGAGAAQTEGARVMRLMRLVNDIQADIYLMGHLHATAVYTPDRLKVDKLGRITSEKLIAAITGSWLKTYSQSEKGRLPISSYGEKKGYKPSRIGNPVISICPDKNEFSIEI